MAWLWRYEASDGTEISPTEQMPETEASPSQADAETWLGENWRALKDAGVAQVTLLDGDRPVYGPMGLDTT